MLLNERSKSLNEVRCLTVWLVHFQKWSSTRLQCIVWLVWPSSLCQRHWGECSGGALKKANRSKLFTGTCESFVWQKLLIVMWYARNNDLRDSSTHYLIIPTNYSILVAMLLCLYICRAFGLKNNVQPLPRPTCLLLVRDQTVHHLNTSTVPT